MLENQKYHSCPQVCLGWPVYMLYWCLMVENPEIFEPSSNMFLSMPRGWKTRIFNIPDEISDISVKNFPLMYDGKDSIWYKLPGSVQFSSLSSVLSCLSVHQWEGEQKVDFSIHVYVCLWLTLLLASDWSNSVRWPNNRKECSDTFNKAFENQLLGKLQKNQIFTHPTSSQGRERESSKLTCLSIYLALWLEKVIFYFLATRCNNNNNVGLHNLRNQFMKVFQGYTDRSELSFSTL